MTVFLLDLWHDLRAKRLWPVAGLLTLALVAVPVVLRDGGGDAPVAAAPATGAASSSASAGKPVVELAEEIDPSDLDAFDSKNPFKPVGRTAAATAAAAAPPSGGGSTSGGGATKPPSSGGGLTGGGPKSGGSPGAGVPPSSPPSGGSPRGDKAYTYVIDVRFGVRGSEKKYEGVRRMEMLPDDKQPLLVFLGVTSSGGSAVFMVDQELQPDGEGACKPSRGSCNFLYLRVDDEHNDHFLTDKTTGTQYRLKLVDIDTVATDELEKREQEEAAKGSSKLRKTEKRPFRFLPFLADERR